MSNHTKQTHKLNPCCFLCLTFSLCLFVCIFTGVCPVLCSAHGHYGGGVCHCEEGWKGSECDIPVGECEVPNCSSHGRCIEGECHCERGWKGPFCDRST